METFVKSSLARRAAASSSQGSATVLKSVKLDSAQNSSGASTNLAEISYTLDSLLNRLTERGMSLCLPLLSLVDRSCLTYMRAS